jgi:hypothetical protein
MAIAEMISHCSLGHQWSPLDISRDVTPVLLIMMELAQTNALMRTSVFS